jgi:hypothetical protein
MTSRLTRQNDLDFPSLGFQHTADKTDFAVGIHQVHHVSDPNLSQVYATLSLHGFRPYSALGVCFLLHYYSPPVNYMYLFFRLAYF